MLGRNDALVDVLIPTFQRQASLALTLGGVAGQRGVAFQVIVSSQDDDADWSQEVLAGVGILRAQRRAVELVHHLPRRGLAEHRQSLLDRATAPYVLFLDDDIWLEPDTLARLVRVIREERCGFVGSAPIGWRWIDHRRPDEETVELWEGPVEPETITRGGPGWDRYRAHNGANILHVARRLGLGPTDAVRYKVAWVGACVLYDAAALRDAGAFSFWEALPPVHAGEDVLAQLRVMRRSGGCGVLPSGAYHLELPTTVPDRTVDAPVVLGM